MPTSRATVNETTITNATTSFLRIPSFPPSNCCNLYLTTFLPANHLEIDIQRSLNGSLFNADWFLKSTPFTSAGHITSGKIKYEKNRIAMIKPPMKIRRPGLKKLNSSYVNTKAFRYNILSFVAIFEQEAQLWKQRAPLLCYHASF